MLGCRIKKKCSTAQPEILNCLDCYRTIYRRIVARAKLDRGRANTLLCSHLSGDHVGLVM